MNYLEKLACIFLIWRLRKGYGANCDGSDLDDFPEMLKPKPSDYVTSSGRCASCRAKETIGFLEENIENLSEWGG